MKRLVVALLLCAGAAFGATSGGIPPKPQGVVFLNLGTPTSGNWRYCTDCAATAPCTGSGSGAFAYRVGSVWNCNTGSPAAGGSFVALDGSTTGATSVIQPFTNGIKTTAITGQVGIGMTPVEMLDITAPITLVAIKAIGTAAADVSGAPPTAPNIVTITGARGGNTTSTSGTTAGTGGRFQVTAGGGGRNLSITTPGVNGTGGAATLQGGGGGGALDPDTSSGGVGGAASLTGGAGGRADLAAAGTGGAVTLTGGVGGQSGTAASGVGGAITIAAGAGGSNALGGTAGNGGNVAINAGAKGTGGTSDGTISLGATKASAVTIGNASSINTIIKPVIADFTNAPHNHSNAANGGALSSPSIAGHIVFTGSAPTVSLCGTDPSIVGNDSAGRVTVGSGVTTTCTLTFATAWTTAPVCHAENETTILLVQPVPTTTTVVLNSGSALTSNVIAYSCRGY